MKNEANWRPSRFLLKNGRLTISRDRRKLAVASRLTASVTLACYNRAIPQYCRGRLLDLGCGTVPYYEYYKQFIEEAVCVDWPLSAHGNQHIDHACDLTQPLPLDDASFDTILMSSVLEHIPEPEALWKEMARVLRAGGTLLLNVPFLYWLHEIPHDYYRYTEYALRRFAEQSGFEVLELEPLGGAPYVVADVTAKTLARTRFVGQMLASVVQGCCRFFVWTPPGKWMCRRTKRQFPSGYFLVARRRQE